METLRISAKAGANIDGDNTASTETTDTTGTGTGAGTANQQSNDNKLQVGVPFPGKTDNYTSTADKPIYQQYITDLYGFSIQLGSSLAVLMIIYAGYKYLTSQGNQTAINDAKEILIGALLGLAILLLVRVILNALALPTVGTT